MSNNNKMLVENAAIYPSGDYKFEYYQFKRRSRDDYGPEPDYTVNRFKNNSDGTYVLFPDDNRLAPATVYSGEQINYEQTEQGKLRAQRDALQARVDKLLETLSIVRDMAHKIVQASQPELVISDAEYREVAILQAVDVMNTIDSAEDTD